MKVKQRWLVVAMVGVIWPGLAAAAIVAGLDRDQVQQGETVMLSLQATGHSQLELPDLTPLQHDFAILGTSHSSSLQIINGVRSASTTLGIALQPLHSGHLQIPALRVGAELTQPLALDVVSGSAGSVPGSAQPGTAANAAVILEGRVAPQNVYVGQQAVYTLRLYFAVNLANGALDDPQVSGLDVHRLGTDSHYQTTRNGQRYNVVERRYAVTPEHAGSVRIPALQFQGQMLDPNDPGGFFGGITPISTTAAPVELQVTPVPGTWGNASWLPSSQVRLSLSGVSSQTQAHVGQPVTVSMRLEAEGVAAANLPALSLPNLAGAQVYPDKAISQDRSSGQTLTGIKEQHFAIVPERAGPLLIPETTVKWWNLRTHQAEYARIPAQTLQVAASPGAATSSGPVAPTRKVAAAASVAPVAATPAASVPVAANPWRGLSYGLLLAWLLTMLLIGIWWYRRRRRASAIATKQRQEPSLGATAAGASAGPAPTRSQSQPKLKQAFMQAAAGSDVLLQEQTLLAWARSERPQLRHLSELREALQPGPQPELIAALQRVRYANGSIAGGALSAAFAAGLAWRSDASTAGSPDAGLPPLYPFKLDR